MGKKQIKNKRVNRSKEIPTLRGMREKHGARNDATLYAGDKDAMSREQKNKLNTKERIEAVRMASKEMTTIQGGGEVDKKAKMYILCIYKEKL